MARPDDLPDFRTPPLNEVVLGVQFAPARGYQQIRAGEVWALFRPEFPYVEELPLIPPSFETFGLPRGPQINFGLVTGASHDRFWFLSPAKEELIQFQNDRFLHNWRKVGEEDNKYPRFEYIIKRFSEELVLLENYFGTLQSQTIDINQCEISYINHIPVEAAGAAIADDWVRFLNFGTSAPDEFSASFRRIVRGLDDQPFGRLGCDTALAVNALGKRVIVLTLSMRGKPRGNDIASALDFLTAGRRSVVQLFAEITTESAHLLWDRSA